MIIKKTNRKFKKVATVIIVVVAVLTTAWFLLFDEHGIPFCRWNWTDGRTDRWEEITSNHELFVPFNGTAFNGDYNCREFTFTISVVSQERELGHLYDRDKITTNQRTFALRGNAYTWDYLQIRVNGNLIRYRFPYLDFGPLVSPEAGASFFRTRGFTLQNGKNEITLTAVSEDRWTSSTIYIIRE